MILFVSLVNSFLHWSVSSTRGCTGLGMSYHQCPVSARHGVAIQYVCVRGREGGKRWGGMVTTTIIIFIIISTINVTIITIATITIITTIITGIIVGSSSSKYLYVKLFGPQQ